MAELLETRPRDGLVVEGFALACPDCRGALEEANGGGRCPRCAAVFRCEGGIWRLLPRARGPLLRRFVTEYTEVRRAEGWGSDDPAYLRGLPFSDTTGRRVSHWRIRAASFEALVDHVVAEAERVHRRPLAVLDLGAGNGWLAARLAARGHEVAAIDLVTDLSDGLGAYVHYRDVYVPIEADFDHLPFVPAQADLAIFNASLHYAPDLAASLGEALRVLRRDGAIAVLDTPVYRDRASGEAMVRERERRFEAHCGFRSDALGGEGFLTLGRLAELGAALGLRWSRYRPPVWWRMRASSLVAQAHGGRERATFPLLVARRREAA